MPVSETTEWAPYRPCSREELFFKFDLPDGTSKYLLILYSLVIGLRGKTIVDFGLGQTTGALRAAALQTDGMVHIPNVDDLRFRYILSEQNED
jgi:hypothetical protein